MVDWTFAAIPSIHLYSLEAFVAIILFQYALYPIFFLFL